MFRGSRPKEPPKAEFFEIDPERGTVSRKSDGARVVILDSVGWATIEKELSSTFMTGSAVILQRMGYSFGRYLGTVAKGQGRTAEHVVELLEGAARESGWGHLTLSSGDIHGGQARIAVRHCFFCANIRESPEPVCHMLLGLIGGVADEMIGNPHRLVEERCIGKGDNLCEFFVERVG